MTDLPPIVVIAGGLGTRLHAISKSIPKSLVPVLGRPFVAHQLTLFHRLGLREVVFCLGHLGEQVEEFVGDGARFGLSVRYSHDGQVLLGTGGAVKRVLPMVGPEFLVTYGDSYLEIDCATIVRAHREKAMPALMTVYRDDEATAACNVEFADGRILAYDKIDKTDRMRHVDYGMLLLTRRAFDGWDDVATFDLSAPLGRLAASGRLAGIDWPRRYQEVGTPAGIAALEAYLAGSGKAVTDGA
jgi:NDP-sugar pyrophosphorylase family protein